MSTIQPISTTRVTDAMTRQRLTSQTQSDQLDLFRLQNQLSTGFRIFLPSDDAPAAQRAMILQRTIERKEQSLTNLQGVQNGLNATESGLQSINTLLNDTRADALAAVDSIASEADRDKLIDTINSVLETLVRSGNSTFTSTYLVGGAERSDEAYQTTNGYVEYLGDESSPNTFVDIGQLFDSGTSGDEVLGGFSESVRGSVDLNGQLAPATRLSQLNGGLGISRDGSIEVTFVPTDTSEPSVSQVIDLSNAKTIEDMSRLIEAGAPSGSNLTVSVEGSSLRIDVSGGGVVINEAFKGETARQLGIVTTEVPSASVVGTDLDPTIAQTDQLSDLVGSKARGRIVSPGDNNDLLLTAKQNGSQYNNVTVNYVNGSSDSAAYDELSNTLTVTIREGDSTANDIAAVINAEATVPFTAETDYRDQTSAGVRGTGKPAASTALSPVNLSVGVAGGVDGELDLASGFLVTNGDQTYEIDTSEAETVEDLLSELNRPEYGLLATVNSAGDGINVRSRRSGADFAIAENGGTTATDLGIRTYTGESRLEDFNRGLGVVIPYDNDETTELNNTFQITVNDQGTQLTYDIDTTDLYTVQDVIDRIAEATDTSGGPPNAPTPAVTASLAEVGNGLVLTRTDALDPASTATGTFAVTGGGFDLTTTATGAGANQDDINVVIVDGTTPGATLSETGDTITVTVDITNDPGNATVQNVADLIATDLGAEFAVSNVTGGTTTATAETNLAAGSLTGGFDADEFTVSGLVAERLGFIESGETSATSNAATLQSTDRNPDEVDSVFTTLIRMREALEDGNEEQFEREITRLDADIERVTFGRSEIGSRLQSLESIEDRLIDEDVSLRSALSEEIDADLIQVISDFTAKQAAMQASLQISGSLLNLTILDFI